MGKNKKLNLLEVTSMAVGTMIGASIFSIFGTGAEVAGKMLPWSFILSGVFALAVAYSYGILGSKIVSNSGPIGFILRGFGDNLVSGSLGFLFWISYVVSISLMVKGFSGYLLPLIGLPQTELYRGMSETAIILAFIGLNFLGSKVVGKAEMYIVFLKLTILLIFIAGGMMFIKPGGITPEITSDTTTGLVNASVIFFLSYMGFGLITNASENLKNPGKNVPRAIYLSISIVLIIYILISVVTLGNLSVEEISKAKENALAVAAKPFFGQTGFLLLSVGALLSLASSLNASIFGGANIAYSLAKNGHLPPFLKRRAWYNATEGLYYTAGSGLVFALIFNLGDMATITSSVFTVIYIFVLISHIRLRKKYGGKLIVLVVNLVIISAVFVELMSYQWNEHQSAFYGTLITFGLAFITELVFRYYKKRKFRQQKEKINGNSGG